MAFEVKVYREVTAFQPKVIFGLSWRQLAVVAVALPVLAGIYAVCFLAGLEDLGVVLVSLIGVPCACLGWWRPKGIPFETYARYAWQQKTGANHLVYGAGEGESDEVSVAKSKRGRRRRRFEFETAPAVGEENSPGPDPL